MTNKELTIVKNEILPAIENGQAMLFLGAGFSINTPTANSSVPSSQRLKEIICSELRLTDTSKIDLQDTFKLGKRKIDNFEKFLLDIFDITKPFDWQIDILRYWWRDIFTTNIDTALEKSVAMLRKQGDGLSPQYSFFGHKDKKPIISGELERNIVKLHGSILRPNDGFIFDRAAYADFSAIKPDWLRNVAANIASGNCLLLGSRFKESDIESAISERFVVHDNISPPPNNWIVLNSFEDYEREIYEDQGIIPIASDIESFVNYVTSNLKPLSQKAFLKRRLPHLHMPDGNLDSFGWFASSFKPISTLIEQATSEHCLRGLYYSGDPIEWKYIAHDAPASLSYQEKIYNAIQTCIQSNFSASVINVTGPVCSGKTTAAMQALKTITISNKSAYLFASKDGINIEHFWRAIKDGKGIFVFYFDNGYEHFYAIDDIIRRANDVPGKRKFIFITESRSSKFEYHQRHFKSIPEEAIINLEFSTLTVNDAKKIVEQVESLGVIYEKFKGKTTQERTNLLIDVRKGYKGDLFAALYDLSSSSSYERQICDEYNDIDDSTAKIIYSTLVIATSIRINFSLSYLSEFCDLPPNSIMRIFSQELKGKIWKAEFSEAYSIRHHSISDFILKKLIDKKTLCEIVIRILNVVATKFSLEDIKYHPLPFRIYREIISYKFLTEIAFNVTHDLDFITYIYNSAEPLFNKDAFFWLQYGKFYGKQKKYEEAVYCLRTGNSMYEAPHITHALGHVLLEKYIADGLKNDCELEEGVDILSASVMQQGKDDPYFATTLIEMAAEIIYNRNLPEHILEKVNEAIKISMHHISNSKFNHALQKLMEAKKKK